MHENATRVAHRRIAAFAGVGDMGRIWTEPGAIRAIRRKGFLNCFSTPERRYFIVSATPLSKSGSRLRYSVGCALMLKRRLELVTGDSFRAAYRLKAIAPEKASRVRRRIQ